MIQSMTGFGDAAEQIQGIHYAVDVRSLNNKFFKAVFRLPEELATLEAELEVALRKRIARGSVTVTIKLRMPDNMTAARVNDAALLVYLEHLETIRSKVASEDQSVNIDLTSLLALPGVLSPAEDETSLLAKARPAVMQLMHQACDHLTQMRHTEGQTIADDLAVHRKAIGQHVQAIGQRAPTVVDEYHQKLRARVDQLMAKAKLKLDENDLIREVAIFAERADIAEELARLKAHLEQFEQIVDEPGDQPMGRTLDFLTQELLREANTIASKSNDAQITRGIVQVKGLIDRIKEQVQNIQ